MKLILVLFSLTTCVYADNNDLFNQAYQLGKQNNFNLNLNGNSSIDSYAASNKLESTIVTNANAGTVNSRDMYNNTYSDNADPNYLYKQGTIEIQNCQTRSDPRCTTLNKYGDKDTLTQIQAYSQGLSDKYYISTRPDPSDSSCTLVTRKVPINQTTATCTAKGRDQNICSTIITPYNNYTPPSPVDGSVIAQGTNQDTSKTYCGVSASITSYETLTAQNKVSIKVTSRNDDGGWNTTKTFDYSMTGTGYQYEYQNNNNGNTNKSMHGSISSGTCNGNSCSVSFTTQCNHGQLGGNDWNRSTTVTLNYLKPIVSSRDIGTTIDDQCGVQRASASCKLINYQCVDKSGNKNIGGHNFNLNEIASQYGLTGDQICWQSTSNYYCGDVSDTCDTYRNNSNCSLSENTCIDKDYISGNCNTFQSKYSCAGGYQDIESQVCTNVVCANNESATIAKCYAPPEPSADNVKNMGSVIAYMQMAQNMAQDMQCADGNAENCTLFSGKYYTCYKYLMDPAQPGSWNNNGADCGLQQEFFNNAGAPTGYAASDRNLYSNATSNSNNVLGGGGNYSLSYDDPRAINNSVQNQQQANIAAVNQDQNITYTPNASSNSSLSVSNGQVASVTINKDLASKTSGFMSFEAYLSDKSVNLAWNRLKGEADPANPKTTTFANLGVTRSPSGNPRGWGMGQPEIQGLCIHLADYCDGGNDAGTSSDLIKSQYAYAGSFSNPNFCAACTNEFLGMCLSGTPKDTMQQWCCFTSKAALDINVAAYDQGLLNFYTGDGSRYGNQVNHPNNICGGVTVGMISRIDFSKGNYFSDMMSAIDIDKLIDTSNFTNANVQINTQNRSNADATGLINEWQNAR